MKKPLSQIALFDFIGEPGQQPQTSTGEQAGVGFRVKSLKKDTQVPHEPIAATGNVAIVVEPAATIPEPAAITAEAETQIAAETPIIVSAQQTAAPQQPPAKSKRGRKSLKQSAAEADLIDIPDDETLFLKQYYTMGEVAGMFRVNQSLLRFWETEFTILQPRKNKKGDRHFRPIDIKNLHLIYHLLRQRKYTIEGAKDFLKKNKKVEERFEAIQRLQQVKGFLLEWKAQL